jgi:hypothetical protein
LLFSEAINHLRGAIDNTVWYLVEREHGPVTGPAAGLVVMPIVKKEEALDDWAKKGEKAGLSALGPNGVLKRVRSLQPFADSATIPSNQPGNGPLDRREGGRRPPSPTATGVLER